VGHIAIAKPCYVTLQIAASQLTDLVSCHQDSGVYIHMGYIDILLSFVPYPLLGLRSLINLRCDDSSSPSSGNRICQLCLQIRSLIGKILAMTFDAIIHSYPIPLCIFPNKSCNFLLSISSSHYPTSIIISQINIHGVKKNR
jgi:hypothetical protein